MRCTNRRPARAGFTMVELLVVIAIIAILMSLTMGAIFRVMARGREVQNKHDIALLETATVTFTTEWKGTRYIPSAIRLKEVLSTYNSGDAIDAASMSFLGSMFPNLDFSNGQVDWNGDGAVSGSYDLQGQESLVFFLGGIPSRTNPPICTGFSTNPANPAAAGGERINPLFDFNTQRLVRASTLGGPAGFLVYLDTYKLKPYAYFAAGRSLNGYNAAGDCARLGVRPYYQNVAQGYWMKPDGCQIISAGPDGRFGAGGIEYSDSQRGTLNIKPTMDDQANFAERNLMRP